MRSSEHIKQPVSKNLGVFGVTKNGRRRTGSGTRTYLYSPIGGYPDITVAVVL